MQCLRCGKEIRNEQVFCENCLAFMEKRPVKPGTAVQIPDKPLSPPERHITQYHRTPSPSEQIHNLRSSVRWLIFTVVTLSLVLMLTATMLIYTLTHQPAQPAPGNLGRNYTSIGDTQP